MIDADSQFGAVTSQQALGPLQCQNWKPVLDYHASMLGFLGWTDRGKVLAGGVLQPGDIKGRSALDEARQLGASV